MLDTDFKFGEVHNLAAQVESGNDKVHFKSIFENSNGGVSLIAFKTGQALAEHQAPAEVMVTVLEGEIAFIIGGKPHVMRPGEFILVGEGVTHSVVANADSKVMLTKVKSCK